MLDFNKKPQDLEEELEFSEQPQKKIRDLKPENKRSRKEPIKPWGLKERMIVLSVLLVTVSLSGFLALTARNFKLPKFPKLGLPNFSEINPFKERVIVVGNSGSKISQEKIERTKKLFKEKTNDYSGLYAFYIYDINGDYFYGVNYQETMQAASLIKLPVMVTAYKSFEDGTLDRDKYTPLVEAMGKRSDNGAFKDMVAGLTKEKINQSIAALGMPHTSLSENTTTPEEIGELLKSLYKGKLINSEDTQELESFLTDTIFEDWLRPGVPKDIRLIHKYGREVHVVNDAGIIDSSKPFVMVIMTDGVIEREADELIPKLAKLLYDSHTDEKTN